MYDPVLTTDRDRIRFALGDTGDPPEFPGGEAGYDAIIATAADAVMAWRMAAAGLAAYLQQQPISLSASGKGMSFDVKRVVYLRSIAAGSAPWPFDPDGMPARQSISTDMEVVW